MEIYWCISRLLIVLCPSHGKTHIKCMSITCRRVYLILRRCLTHEEAEHFLNDSHSRACGGHLSGLATTQKILRASYFWPMIFKYCVEVVKHCHPCQLYTRKTRSYPTPLFFVISVGCFTKWGIDYMMCNPVSAGGHKHIIVVVDYFMKWTEVMPTYKADREIVAFSFSTKLSHDSISLK